MWPRKYTDRQVCYLCRPKFHQVINTGLSVVVFLPLLPRSPYFHYWPSFYEIMHMCNFKYDPFMLVFVDETGCDCRNNKNYGHSVRGG